MIIQFIIDALIRTVDLSLIAIALSTVYSLIRFPNIALVQYATGGAFIAIELHACGVPLIVAIISASTIVGIVATIFNIFLFERLLKNGPAIAMIGSLALSMLFSACFIVSVGSSSRRFDFPIRPPFDFFDAKITEPQLFSIALTVAAIGALAFILFKTNLGRFIRATATNPVLAQASGLDTRRITNIVVFLSGFLASLGGIALSIKGELNSQVGVDLLLPVFAAAILGGLGNALGALPGAMIIAIAETIVTNVNIGPLFGKSFLFIPAAYATAASFCLLVAVLLLRPQGLLVSEVKRV